MLASIPSATVLGASGQPVTVEVHVAAGLPGYRLVGMPDAACRESRDRVRAAVHEQRARLAAEGHHRQPRAVRVARRPVPVSTWRSPSACSWRQGSWRRRPSPATGSSASSVSTARCGGSRGRRRWSPCWATSSPSSPSAAAPRPASRRPARCAWRRRWPRSSPRSRRTSRGRTSPTTMAAVEVPTLPDLADVRGQPIARQALEIAAAGGHHLLMVGAAGFGQDDAGPAADQPAAAADPVRVAGGDDDPLGGGQRHAGRRARHDRAVPGAAPHQLRRRARRRRFDDAAARRDQPQPRRSPLPRRARRVPGVGAGCAARAAGGGRDPRRSCCRPRRAAGALPARRGDQSVPVRRWARLAVASATTPLGCATSAGCPGRCSIASTCGWRSIARASTSCSTPAAASRAPSWRRGSPGPDGSPRPDPPGSTPNCAARCSTR